MYNNKMQFFAFRTKKGEGVWNADTERPREITSFPTPPTDPRDDPVFSPALSLLLPTPQHCLTDRDDLVISPDLFFFFNPPHRYLICHYSYQPRSAT